MSPSTPISSSASKWGFDFVFLDCEHGNFADDDLKNGIDAVNQTNALSFVRASSHDIEEINRIIDHGPDAVIIPHVNSADEIEENSDIFVSLDGIGLIVILESSLGVENIDAILATGLIDALFIGPMDLSADLGAGGDFAQKAYTEALTTVEFHARTHNIPIGTIPHGDYSLSRLADQGHRLFILGTDHQLDVDDMMDQVAAARRMLAEPSETRRVRDVQTVLNQLRR